MTHERPDLDGPTPPYCSMPLTVPIIVGAAVVLAGIAFAAWHFLNR